ncbi:hypothetical protein BS78_02G087800 [Paspalum vaginatum]|nr:hypothetical protein BS78_02G087800 [Paspalum vaginatum]
MRGCIDDNRTIGRSSDWQLASMTLEQRQQWTISRHQAPNQAAPVDANNWLGRAFG